MDRPYVLNPHFDLAANEKPLFGFDPAADLDAQKKRMSDKLAELMGVPEKRTSPEPVIDFVSDADPRFDEIRFRFESEPNFFVPAHMLLPKGVWKSGVKKLPTVICLQASDRSGNTAYPEKQRDGIRSSQSLQLRRNLKKMAVI